MTKIDAFVEFAKTLDPQALSDIEAALGKIMDNYAHETGLTLEQLTDIEARRANPHKTYATEDQIAKLLGRRI